MNSLMGYGSDDDSESSAEETFRESVSGAPKTFRKAEQGQEDVNYEEVGMDMSEDSDKEQQASKKEDSRWDDRANKNSKSEHKKDERRKDDRHSDRRERDDRRDKYSREDRDTEKRDRDDDRRDRRRDDRSNRDSRYGRDRDRKDRDRRRSRSRDKDRRRSRSPKRSRSKSKERGFNRRFDKAAARAEKIDKMGIDMKLNPSLLSQLEDPDKQQSASNDRFFMPGITGRFRDQIERRKMLWQKGKDQPQPEQSTSVIKKPVAVVGENRSEKVWKNTSFGDDKTSNKFKRLMGIRDAGETSASGKPATEVLKKQEQMFNSMEAQYEVARAATHTMRGVGLGFGSFQR